MKKKRYLLTEKLTYLSSPAILLRNNARRGNMAQFLLLLPLGLCLWGLKWVKGIREDCLSRDSTDALRGVLALGIILVHIAQYCPGGAMFALAEKTGYLLVAGFFFLSGFSLQKQHMTQKNYCKGFLKKRLLGVLLPYLVVTALYWSFYHLLGHRYTLWDVLRMFAEGKPIVSFSWYIPAVLTFYLAFWGLMQLCKNSYPTMVLGGAVWFAVYCVVCLGLRFGQWWYISAFPAVLGMAWAVHQKALEEILKKRYFAVLLPVSAAFAGVIILENYLHLGALNAVLKALAATLFVAGAVLLLYKIRVGNPVLRVLGQMSMELYLMQGLAIMVPRSRWIYIENPLLYGLLILVLAVIFATVVHIALKGIPKKPTH